MIKFFLIFFLVSFSLFSCSSTEKKDDLQDAVQKNSVAVTESEADTDAEIPDEEIADPCDPNPCSEQNRNICTSDKSSFKCSCNEGFREISGICTDKKVLVLSVGAERGLAHIGAIDAFKELNIQFDAVYGNSMGALIGSLYAVSPKQDISSRYVKLINEFEPKYYEIVKTFELFFNGLDNEKLREYLNNLNNNIKIEETAIPFATSYFNILDGHLNLHIAKNGNLAASVAASANNPIIFTSRKINEIEKLDPGFDRVSAIPVEDACELFGPALLYVVNVIGDEILVSKKMNCEYIEIKIPVIGNIDVKNVMRGKDPDFSKIKNLGYQAVMQKLKSEE